MSEGNNKNKDESATVIDFTLAKLEQMADEYEDMGMYTQAEEVLNAIEQYKLGIIDIKWQKGMPYVVLTPDGKPKKPAKTD